MPPQEENRVSGPIIDRDTLGEYLRKIRIGNRIDIHKMAADTKLNMEYITAIEKNEFGKIPGETYRKIFIKNIAKYLDLDPEETYQRYLREPDAPLTPAAPQDGKPETAAQPVETEEKKPSHSTIKPPVRNIIIFLCVILAVFVLLMLSQSGKQEQATDALVSDTAEAQSQGEQSRLHAPPFRDSASLATPFLDETVGALKVRLTAETDSVLVMVFRNGKLWTNIFRKANSKIFASDTALYFNLSGMDYKVTFILNKDPLRYDPGMGRIVRVAPGGLTTISRNTWDRLISAR